MLEIKSSKLTLLSKHAKMSATVNKDWLIFDEWNYLKTEFCGIGPQNSKTIKESFHRQDMPISPVACTINIL
jgi:hypothetical protein